MTLTFLILAGQVKVKGQLGEMAKCLEDGDRRIADLAKMFFTELSTKDNAIYNGFYDIFSMLSSDKNPLEEYSLKRILKFLMSFIEKVISKVLEQVSNNGRRSTLSNLQRNWLHASHGVCLRDNGMMSPMPCLYFPIRTKKFRRLWARVSDTAQQR